MLIRFGPKPAPVLSYDEALDLLKRQVAATGWPSNPMAYRVYRKSKHWHYMRARVFDRAGGLCEEGPHEHKRIARLVHHETYERLGCEKMRDLIAVCHECHNEIHGRGGRMWNSGFGTRPRA